MIDFFKKEKEIINQNEMSCDLNFFEDLFESTNQNMAFTNTNEINVENAPFSFLNKKRKDIQNTKPIKKHTKFSSDNLKRECKHLVLENVRKFINNKISETYEGNIGKGLMKKKLFKLNQSQKINANAEFNRKFISQSLKEILSQNITKQITIYDLDHNKKVIEKIILEKKDKFEKLFNLTFIECVKHFIGDKKIEELNGLTLFTELKEQILKKHKKDGESYYENLKLFLKGYECIITRTKSRKKRVETTKENE